MRAVVVVVACTACGRIAFDRIGTGGTGDAGDGGTTIDSAIPYCKNWGLFSAPVHSDLSSTDDEYATAITADNRIVVFDSRRMPGAGDWDLWIATRADAAM